MLDKLPLRCVPIIYMDSNCQMGLQKQGSITYQVDTHVMGESCRGMENNMGRLPRNYLEHNNLYDTISDYPNPRTFSSGSSDSMTFIDRIITTKSMVDGSNVRTRVWKHTGRRTQNVKSARIIHHLPVVMTFCMNLMKTLRIKNQTLTDMMLSDA